MDCLKNYIGIRGECDESKLYLDDLTGINIDVVDNVTNGVDIRPMDIVNKCFKLAKDEVFQSLVSQFTTTYNRIIDDASYRYAGSDSYYGEVNENWKIKINRFELKQFIQLHVFNLELISDRDIEVEFILTDAYGFSKIITQELKQGFNQIKLNHTSKSSHIQIEFNLSYFKIGMINALDYYTPLGSCRPCSRTGSGSCQCLGIEIYKDDEKQFSNRIGFNLIARCESDECELMEYFAPILDLPLLYKTGINFLLERKLTGRYNPYLRNTAEEVEELLTLWMGGYDNAADVKVPSIYKSKIKEAANSLNSIILDLDSELFTRNTGHIYNSLP